MLYVALTRPMNELIITRTLSDETSYFNFYNKEAHEAYFLKNIPDQLVDKKFMDSFQGIKSEQSFVMEDVFL